MSQQSTPPPGVEAPARIRAALSARGLCGPLAYVDLDAFDRNAAALLARTGGKPIRVASKSVRVPALLRRVLDSSRQYQGVLAFSVREAVHLASQHGLDDLLVAYPTPDARAVSAAARLVAAGRQITLMVDSEAQLPLLEAAAQAAGTRLAVCLDLDVSQDYLGLRFGMFRSPLNDVNGVLRLAERIGHSQWLRLDGLMAYEGQVAGLADAARDPRTLAIRELKRRALPAIAERRASAVAALERAGHQLRFVNAGAPAAWKAAPPKPA
ncbi:alanine racemase [Deinococcus lacus]|uniref:Alanine racemase n=1 Tax=Deinococcus lacus TaxID=392561 RepID=A0ABW1YCZ2_9DEIO